MKATIAACVSSLIVSVIAWAQPAWSDSTEASCKLTRADDTKNKKASGRCKFSERLGRITIQLNDGTTVELKPKEEANHYRDDKGRKVVRTASGNTHVYTWKSGREIVVEFPSSGYGSGNRPSTGGGGRNRRELTCESHDRNLRNCKVPNLDEQSVRLERELSGPECIHGKSWGTQPGLIWVESGCRAVFSYRVND